MSNIPEINILDAKNPKLLTEFTSGDLDEIREIFEKSETVITLCLPMERAGAETRKNHIVFKNAVAEASGRLSRNGVENRGLDLALRDLSALDDATSEFWQHQKDGLLMFIDGVSPIVCARLPFSVGPDVQIGDSPYLRPLHRLADPERYFVLSLDLNELKLYEATRWKLRELGLENVPTSLADAMKYDDPEESLQFRSAYASSGKSGPAPLYHGHGVTTDATENEKIQRYFEMVSKNIAENFPDRKTELILLGPGPERSRYREANHYEKLAEYEIDLNPSNSDEEELEGIVAEHIKKLEARSLTAGLESLESQIANDSGSTDAGEVVEALMSSKVDTLFYKAGAKVYGQVSRDTFEVDIHERPKSGDTELVGYCAERAIDTGARVRVLENNEFDLPDGSPMAASYRY